MKKKTQTFNKDLKMPRLFREDLIMIEKIIKEELKPVEYKIETKDYDYDDVESISNDTESTTDLRIQTSGPRVSIDFNKLSAKVYAEDDLSAMGALDKIMGILLRKERKLLYWSQKLASWLAAFLFLGPILLVFIEIKEINLTKSWVMLGVSLVAMIWWIVSFYSSMYKYSTINFVFYKDKPGFLRRNKDQIILSIVSAIIGAIFGTVLSNLFSICR